MQKFVSTLLAAAALLGPVPAWATPAPTDGEPAFRALFKEMIEINSSQEGGSCTIVVDKLAARMKAAGFPEDDLHRFVPPSDAKAGILVAVLPGRDPKLKPVLMLGHIDVVNARREDWTRDPYSLIEENGFFYARGVADMKGQDAIWADNMIRYHAEGYKPLRTIKMALTCGEEGGGFVNGARWLAENQRQLIDAGIAFNEGGYGELDDSGKRIDQTFQAAQKVVMGFTLETTNPGGHSSVPRPDNAIYSLARALDRMSRYDFPIDFIEANRGYFTRMSKLIGGADGAAMAAIVANPQDTAAAAQLDKNPTYHTMLRTTCVATMLSGGHAANALPQRATATVNCRVVPGETPEHVRDALVKAIADPEVKVTGGRAYMPAPPAPVTEAILAPAQRLAAKTWPGVPLVPHMQPGASDAVTLNAAGIPTYGFSGLFREPDNNGVHGLNERLRIRSLLEGRAYMYQTIKAYADDKSWG